MQRRDNMLKIGRIPYINCYPVYGGIDRGVIPFSGELVSDVPTGLNRLMADGSLDLSVVSAVEYARDSSRYLLLPEIGITSNGPVRSVMLFSRRPISELDGRRVVVSRSSMTSVALLQMLSAGHWSIAPEFIHGDAELVDTAHFMDEPHDARLVIGDAALHLFSAVRGGGMWSEFYPYHVDLGAAWKEWTGLPFVFAVWVAQRKTPVHEALSVHASLIASRDWGLAHIGELAHQAADSTGIPEQVCREYFDGLDYRLSWDHIAGLSEFFRRLATAGHIPDSTLTFLPAA